ncbi:hypothetical protein [Paenibacillus sp. GCM10027626]|uniref:hypothetical protein n=1 Tax=Paenibacillus sp. GCM10027626 TaxID=3273411 RepID=UPI003629A17F
MAFSYAAPPTNFLLHPHYTCSFHLAQDAMHAWRLYTYLTPLLQKVLFVPDQYISLVFLLYGIVSIFSTLIGGRLAARNGLRKLRYVFLIQAVVLASLYFSSGSMIGGLISVSFIALIVYILNSTIQLYFIDLANKHYPAAKDLASSLTPVSINIGIALGSSLGGFVTTKMKLIDVSWFGAIVAILASALTFISWSLDRPQISQQQKGRVLEQN